MPSGTSSSPAISLEALAVGGLGDLARDAAAARRVRHQHGVAAGKRQIGGQRRALVAALLLHHLHQDDLAAPDHLLDLVGAPAPAPGPLGQLPRARPPSRPIRRSRRRRRRLPSFIATGWPTVSPASASSSSSSSWLRRVAHDGLGRFVASGSSARSARSDTSWTRSLASMATLAAGSSRAWCRSRLRIDLQSCHRNGLGCGVRWPRSASLGRLSFMASAPAPSAPAATSGRGLVLGGLCCRARGSPLRPLPRAAPDGPRLGSDNSRDEFR